MPVIGSCSVTQLQTAVRMPRLKTKTLSVIARQNMDDVYEARRRVAEKALRHAINCEMMCEHLQEYVHKPQLQAYRTECVINARLAWDVVEEVYAALADLRYLQDLSDPLEIYCKDFPDADECRIYDV